MGTSTDALLNVGAEAVCVSVRERGRAQVGVNRRGCSWASVGGRDEQGCAFGYVHVRMWAYTFGLV